MYKHTMSIFKIVIIIATLMSFYIFFNKLYDIKKGGVNAWQFPMLLAILIELYM